ncbi:MAG: hypothetical protein L3J07_04150 [Candidatus Magasanikbacteria bacterium]|nr:hypothetical protein [Candidatus Magasanikbacteria bacterium]
MKCTQCENGQIRVWDYNENKCLKKEAVSSIGICAKCDSCFAKFFIKREGLCLQYLDQISQNPVEVIFDKRGFEVSCGRSWFFEGKTYKPSKAVLKKLANSPKLSDFIKKI